jgi:hypothetical protein
MKAGKLILLLLVAAATAHAQLAVTVSPPRFSGNKVVVKLELKNKLSERVESARAACFLLDQQGKIVAQSARWVIGGAQNKLSLASGATNTFHFVIDSDKPFTTTNLTAKVSFSRVVLKGGKPADVTKEVNLNQTTK